jgi:hypothetical protein
MITRYLLTVKMSFREYQRSVDRHEAKGMIILPDGHFYQHVIHWNLATFFLWLKDTQDGLDREYVILNSHKLTDEEYEHISTTMTVEDYTRDD